MSVSINVRTITLGYHFHNKLAVLIFVHGENFRVGSGNAYDLSILSSYGDIICVTINYRLGILGFLNFANGESDGNYALHDLFAAMLWVRSHIKHFNGDPNNISLMGYGDGAVLLHFFTKSKLFQNNNLITIKRLILMNGNGAPFFSKHPIESVNEDIVKFFHQTRKSLLNYLKLINVSDILAAQLKLKSNILFDFLTPMFTSQLFNFNEQLQTDKNLLDLDLWIGVMRNNAGKYFNKVEKMSQSEMTIEQFKFLIKNFVDENQLCHRDILSQVIEHFYTNWSLSISGLTQYAKSDMRISGFNQLINDAFFIAPAIKMANYHSQFQKYHSTFLHFFDILPEQSEQNFVSDADYSDDLALFFGAPLASPETIEPFHQRNIQSLLNLSLEMMGQLSAFIKTGNPNFRKMSPAQNRKVPWPKYLHSTKHYLHYHMKENIPIISTSSNLMPDAAQFWNILIPNLCSKENLTKSSPHPHDLPVKLVVRYIELPNENIRTTFNSIDIENYSEPPMTSRKSWDKFILIITITIGICLLVFNLTIFVGIFYQVRKLRLLKLSCSRQKSLNAIGDVHRNIHLNNSHISFGPQESIPLAIKNNNYEFLDLVQ